MLSLAVPYTAIRRLALGVAALCCSGLAHAYLDLAAASIDTLDNGLTVIVLEERSFPVVSVQMLYKAGARNEAIGKTGLAHFLEHMAFRGSENFPDTGLVSAIYARGGEWHGYTWLDQTTYFATAPAEELDLLLRIESERMARLNILPGEVDSERGAVLAEMHGYENDPQSVLHDYVLYLSFLAHPYRNNTIGWESDIARVQHADLVDFYRQHYQPGNAVLAVVGDVRKSDVMARVRHHFAGLEGRAPSLAPHTVEPEQRGERRIVLRGPLDKKHFKVAYHAPSVHSPDFVAFLVIQELLAGGGGVNFLQNDWVSPVRPGTALWAVSEELATWFPPSAQDYVFTIGGSIAASSGEADTEEAIELAIDELKKLFSSSAPDASVALQAARERVLRELELDIQTTEDAAHQLAFFTGLDGLATLVKINESLQQLKPADLGRVLDRYFSSERRTIGWYIPGEKAASPASQAGMSREVQSGPWAGGTGLAGVGNAAAGSPMAVELSNGLRVLIQRSPLSRAALLRVVIPSADYSHVQGLSEGSPAWGLGTLDFEVRPAEMALAIGQAASIFESTEPSKPVAEGGAGFPGPEALLEQALADILGLEHRASGRRGPGLLVITGDIEPASLVQQLDAAFADLPVMQALARDIPEPVPHRKVDTFAEFPIAQEQLGYVVRVPEGNEQATAWQMALYILTHGYEGRLGKEAIARRGLVYYIDSEYQTDGSNDWVTIRIGVDPDKLPAMEKLLRDELARMLSMPPTENEIAEARAHLLGRDISAAQSNSELADKLAREWVLQGRLPDHDGLKKRLDSISREDVLKLLPEFTSGSIVTVRNPQLPRGE